MAKQIWTPDGWRDAACTERETGHAEEARPPTESPSGGGDPGQLVLGTLADRLMIDEEWSTRQERMLTWWPYRLAQHLEVSEPYAVDDGATAVCVHVWSDVVTSVTDTQAAIEVTDVANQRETLSALVYDPDRRTIVESFGCVLFADTVSMWAQPLALAAILQSAAAHSRAHSLAGVVGGTPAHSDHPSSGRRPEVDDMLNVPEQLVVPRGGEPSAFEGPLLQALTRAALDWYPSTGGEHGFTAEVPFRDDIPAVVALGEGMVEEGPGTALVRVWADVAHPDYGSGALLALQLPPNLGDEAAAAAGRLNLAASTTEMTALGAWSSVPGDPGSLAFSCFLPSVIAQPGLLENLLLMAGMQALWARDNLG